MNPFIRHSAIAALIVWMTASTTGQVYTLNNLWTMAIPSDNAAMSSLDDHTNITVYYKSLWVDFEGAPSVFYFSFQRPSNYWFGSYGVDMRREQAGLDRKDRWSAWLAFEVPLRRGRLALALRSGLYQWRLNGSLVRTPEGFYQGLIAHADPILPQSSYQANTSFINLSLAMRLWATEWQVSLIHLLIAPWKALSYGRYEPAPIFTTAVLYYYALPYGMRLNGYVRAVVEHNRWHAQSGWTVSGGRYYRGGVGLLWAKPLRLSGVLMHAGFQIQPQLYMDITYSLPIGSVRRLTRSEGFEIALQYSIPTRRKLPKRHIIIYNPIMF